MTKSKHVIQDPPCQIQNRKVLKYHFLIEIGILLLSIQKFITFLETQL